MEQLDLFEYCFEVWKDIEGFEGYQVSNWGRVKSLSQPTHKNEIFLKQQDSFGYKRVVLYEKGNKRNHRWFRVHQLVANAFIPNPDPSKYTQINHKDENKQNNRADNLEWCTASENINYGTRNERVSAKQSRAVKQYTLDGVFVKTWKCMMDVQRQMGINAGNISSCCVGKYNQAGGFRWEYV